MTNQLGATTPEARTSMLDIAAAAALGRHDLTGFADVEDDETSTVGHCDGDPNGYQAVCRRCGLSAWVDDSGLAYNLLADVCPGGTSEVSS